MDIQLKPNKRIKAFVVDDSPLAVELLVYILSSDPAIEVIGTACNGEDALSKLKYLKPDIITMDAHMPKMDGFEATRRIMEEFPAPIIIATASFTANELNMAMKAMDAGALTVMLKPSGFLGKEAEELIRNVMTLSEVKVIRRWKAKEKIYPEIPVKALHMKDIRLVAIGSSIGGPPVLQNILSRLPKDFPVPVLIVQHITSGFTAGLVEWLGQTSALPVHLAVHGEQTLSGHVYVAADGCHMKVDKSLKINLTLDEPEYGLRPSVAQLFRSIANEIGKNAVGVILTGMGKDGAKELKMMKDRGAVTIAQDEQSSVVHGMAGEAISLGAVDVDNVLPPEKIAEVLVNLVS